METGKPVCAPVHISSAAAQTEKRMDVQAPLTAVYIHTVPALPAQPFPQLPAAAREPATLHLAMPPLYSKENLRFLTLHIAGGLHSSPGLSLAATAPTARPKSTGKHVCPHCGRDCMKPSVLEKHLRCHTGERPYPCSTCGVSFKTQSNLYKHKRTQAHARLSSESEQSSLGSLDSLSSSRETHSSSLSLDEHSEETGSMEKDATLPAAEITCPADTTEVFSVTTPGSGCEQRDLAPANHKTDSNESAKVRKVEENLIVEIEQSPLTVGRHLPLQRQKATVFSKQWERSVSRGKSQNHESTDSGFSESSDHYPNPGSVLHGHSLDSLTESNKEHLEETTNTHTSSEPDQGAREQEQKTLEERISKLISENTAVVEDKQLENVRPRKTVLSKQGSIDLPLPYTYKDSFHFDMKISRTPNVGLQRNRKPGLYSSMPTQQSTTMEHGPLTRSNSLPFSVTLLQPERSSSASSYQSNYESLVCRGSSGQINPAGFAINPVNQQSSSHRPLVRQTAVDCNHATDGLFRNSSVEEASTGSLSCDGDICGEPSNRKFRRKKAQKFAYDKWYMYGGGTFTKLYNTEKDGDKSVVKGRKCMNAKHVAFQAPQKKLSSAHKETVTTGSAINIPNSRATVSHPACSPAKTSLSSTVDVNVRTTQLYSPCSSVKTPIRRNLSLSILPLPSVGSLVSHEADSLSSTGAGPNEEHTDSISELCGAHVPSDRKKQRTADESICQLEMETAPNTLSYPPPSVTGSALQQDAHFSYVNLQKKKKHSQLKGALFSPCIIKANAQSVSTLPPTSLPSAVKTSFLPKYQLRLPNAGEHDSNTSLNVVDKPTVTGGCTFTSPTSSSKTEQTSPSVTAPEIKLSDPVTSALMQTGDSKKTNALNSTQAQLFMPCTAATFCQAETSRFTENMTSSLPVVHKQFAATTITTACLHDYQEGLCSTLIQPSKSAPVQLPSPVAPVVAHFPAIPSISTENNQISATSSTTISQCRFNSNLPLSHLQYLPESEQSSFVNRAFNGPNTPKVPCHIVPFDQVQPAGQNVFHVHTADLQICLQIISDEQLALIEPQIERHEDSSLSQRRHMQAQSAEVIQNEAQSSAATERSNEGTDHRLQRYQKELDQNESLSTLYVERIEPPLTAHMTEHRNSRQATLSAESKPPEAPGLTTHPHKCSHVNTATETLNFASDVMSTAAVRSGRSQTSQEERALSLNSFPEEQPFLGSRVSQGELVLQTLSGLPLNSVNQNRKSELLVKDIHQKPINQGASCEASIMKTKCEASACGSSRLESGETPCSMHVRFDKASADELSGSLFPFSINNCKASRKLNPHASICCSIPSDHTISETVDPFKHENTSCDGVGPSDNSVTLPEKTLCDSQDVISLAHSQKLFTSESSNIHVERTKDIPAVLTSVQSPTAGSLEGDCLVECEVQKEPQKWGHVGIPGQSDCTDWRPKLSQEDRETTHPGIDGQSCGGLMREDKNGRIKADTVPGELANTESNCRYTALPDMIELEGQDTEVKVDSFKNSWLSEEHLQHLSQTHSGMSEYPLQRPQQALSKSNNLDLPANGSETSLLNSSKPPLEVNNVNFSQQHWESSVGRTKQTQTLCESNSSKPIKTQAQFKETQNAFSQVTQQTTFSHQEKQTPSVQQGHTAGNDSTAVGHSSEVTLGSNKTSGLLADIKTSCATHHCQVSHSLQVSQASAGWTGNTQTSNTNMLGYNTGARLKPFTYQEPELDPEDQAPHEYITHSSNSGRTDTTNKYQSFFLAAQLQGYQPAESLTAGVKPVQSCQDSSEDTSSSDDEGKLIIEL